MVMISELLKEGAKLLPIAQIYLFRRTNVH